MRIGWIGTGVMGGPMVGHLLDAGHELWISTRTRSRASELEAAGARWMGDAPQVLPTLDLLCTMVGFPADVEEVLLGAEGALQHLREGAALIDFTTSSPSLAERIHEEAAARRVDALDAPVSGGDVGARNAALSIMIGGEEAVYQRLRPVFETVGRTIVYQGGAGMGQHAKMANQLLVASNMIGVCEALVYAVRAGLEPGTVLRSLTSGAATSWSLENLGPRILQGNFEPGFFVEHFVKDMGIALAECRRMGLDLPGLELGHRLYAELVERGYGRKGTQALYLGYAGEG